MNRVNLKLPRTLAVFALFLCLNLAQGETGTFAGRVVNLAGNPVADLPVFIGPTRIEDVLDWHRPAFFPEDYPLLQRARTDADGRFAITGIPSGPAYFSALPYNIAARLPSRLKEMTEEQIGALFMEALETEGESGLQALVSSSFGMERTDFEPDVEVLSLRIHGSSFYPRNDSETIVFAIRTGMHIEDAVVTVQPRMRIRGQLLFKEGTPLANARISLNIRSRHADGTIKGSSGSVSKPWTDAEGHFVHYLDEKDDDAFYTVVALYKTLEAEAAPVLLKPGERYDGLVLTFNSEPISPEPKVPLKTTPTEETVASPSKFVSNEVWIGNPANGHVYKRIQCETREEALAIANDEDAHLVAINDETEQQWVSAVFGGEFYWIGLSRPATEWRWSDGESVTYENWLPADFFSESIEPGKHTAAIMTIEGGKWYAVNADSVLTKLTEWAILEKGVPAQTPKK